MVARAAENNGCLEFMALKNHYEGVVVQATNAVNYDKVLNHFFHSGENKPHMWGEEFGRQLTDSFNTYNHLDKRNVHLKLYETTYIK